MAADEAVTEFPIQRRGVLLVPGARLLETRQRTIPSQKRGGGDCFGNQPVGRKSAHLAVLFLMQSKRLVERHRPSQRHRRGSVDYCGEHPAGVAAVAARGRPVEARGDVDGRHRRAILRRAVTFKLARGATYRRSRGYGATAPGDSKERAMPKQTKATRKAAAKKAAATRAKK